MGYKVIESTYDTDGFSYVEIKTPKDWYCGCAQLHPDDKDIESEFFGCSLAEGRAVKYYYMDKIREKKKEIKVLENLIKSLEQLKDYNKKCHEARFIRKTYYIKQKELKQLQTIVENIEKSMKNSIDNFRTNREAFYKKVEENKKKKEEKSTTKE